MFLTRRRVIVGSAALACVQLPAWAAEPIHFATLPAMDFIVPVLAQEAGLFKKHGLDVEVQLATNAPTLLPSVIGGSLQLGVSTCIQVAAANEAGLDVVIVAGGGTITRQDIRTAIVMRPDAKIEKPQDLVGKKVVVPGLNGTFHVLFLRYLKRGGVDPKQVNVIEGGFAQMPDLLRSGQVDAVLATDPFLSRMLENGVGKRLDYFIPESGFAFTSFFIAKRSWVDTHREALEAVRAAMRDAVAKAANEPDFRTAAVAKSLKLPPDVLARQKPYDWRVDVKPEDLTFWIDLGVELGLLQQKVDPSKLLA